MPEFLEPSFLWPTLPATLLLIASCLYWLLVIVGAVTVDALHLDLPDVHIDTDIDGSIADLGLVPLRFLNIGRVPLMLWVSLFALSAWGVSRLIAVNGGSPQPHAGFDFSTDALAIVRDFAIGAVAAKLLTQPLRGLFDVAEPIGAAELLGKTCVVSTSEVTDRQGEANFATGSAPLLLHVRASEGGLRKGDLARIVDYSPEENVYFVQRAEREV